MRTGIGAGAAVVEAGAAASLPHAARRAGIISAAEQATAYEGNRRKKGIDAFPGGGMTGIEQGNAQRLERASARLYTIADRP
jgi:hypothetical protein